MSGVASGGLADSGHRARGISITGKTYLKAIERMSSLKKIAYTRGRRRKAAAINKNAPDCSGA